MRHFTLFAMLVLLLLALIGCGNVRPDMEKLSARTWQSECDENPRFCVEGEKSDKSSVSEDDALIVIYDKNGKITKRILDK